CSIAGVVLMETTGGLDEAEASAFPRGLAIGSTLFAAFATAVAMLGLHRLRHLHPWAIVAHFSGVALLFSVAAYGLGSHPVLPANETPTKTLLLLLAVGGTATVGQLFLTKAFVSGPPTKIAVVNLTQIVFAVLFDVAVASRRVNVLMLTGMVLVVAPTAWLMLSQERTEPEPRT
ncbi:MAG: EamA family transporter, partial [Gemmataceae bacterium]